MHLPIIPRSNYKKDNLELKTVVGISEKMIHALSVVYICATVKGRTIFIVFGCYLEGKLKASSTVSLRELYEVKNVVSLDQGLIKQRQTGKDFKEPSK